jgi:hypothetical protein
MRYSLFSMEKAGHSRTSQTSQTFSTHMRSITDTLRSRDYPHHKASFQSHQISRKCISRISGKHASTALNHSSHDPLQSEIPISSTAKNAKRSRIRHSGGGFLGARHRSLRNHITPHRSIIWQARTRDCKPHSLYATSRPAPGQL